MKSNFETEELKKLAKMVKSCLQCTTCASACPVFQTDSSRNPRMIIQRLAMEDFENLFDEVDIWWCGGCYTCEVHCPQGVPLTRILYELKNILFGFGKNIPSQIRHSGECLKTGLIFPLRNEMVEKRKQLKLPGIKKPDSAELETILRQTGFIKNES